MMRNYLIIYSVDFVLENSCLKVKNMILCMQMGEISYNKKGTFNNPMLSAAKFVAPKSLMDELGAFAIQIVLKILK